MDARERKPPPGAAGVVLRGGMVGSGRSPDGVECGGTEFVEEFHGAVPEKLVHPGQAKADPGGARDDLANMHASKDGRDLDGPEHLIKELDYGLVEPEQEGDEEAEEGGRADNPLPPKNPVSYQAVANRAAAPVS